MAANIMAFIMWEIVAVVFLVIAISCRKAGKPVGFFSNVKPPEIPEENIGNYNRAVSNIWFVFTGIFALLGIPMLFFEQNSAGYIFLILAFPPLIIGTIVAYFKVEARYK